MRTTIRLAVFSLLAYCLLDAADGLHQFGFLAVACGFYLLGLSSASRPATVYLPKPMPVFVRDRRSQERAGPAPTFTSEQATSLIRSLREDRQAEETTLKSNEG